MSCLLFLIGARDNVYWKYKIVHFDKKKKRSVEIESSNATVAQIEPYKMWRQEWDEHIECVIICLLAPKAL